MINPNYQERRVSTRYEDKIQVDLILSENNILPIEICSISITGLQITCDGWLADEIEPQGIQRLAMSHKKLRISANLPFDHISKNIVINSHIVAVRRLSQDNFLIGLEYESIENDGKEILEQYIEQLKLEIETH